MSQKSQVLLALFFYRDIEMKEIHTKYDLAEILFDIFVNQQTIWYKQYKHHDNFGYVAVTPESKKYQPLGLSLIIRHIEGELTLSLPSVSEFFTCKWACFDSDENDGRLGKVEEQLKELGIEYLKEGRRFDTERNDWKEGHIWILFDKPVAALDLLELKELILTRAGLTDKHIEFFPKSATTVSQMRLPLSIHQKKGAGEITWFEGVERDTEKQIRWLASQPKNRADGVAELAKLRRKQKLQAAPIKERERYPKNTENIREGLSILPYVGTTKRLGKDLAAACPLCRLEGLDKKGDNLRIAPDGRFNCVNGGPNSRHTTREIYQYFGG